MGADIVFAMALFVAIAMGAVPSVAELAAPIACTAAGAGSCCQHCQGSGTRGVVNSVFDMPKAAAV